MFAYHIFYRGMVNNSTYTYQPQQNTLLHNENFVQYYKQVMGNTKSANDDVEKVEGKNKHHRKRGERAESHSKR
jgi:hypothetical protein